MSQSIKWNPGDTPEETYRSYLATLRKNGEAEVTEAWFNKDSLGKWYVNSNRQMVPVGNGTVVAWADMPKPFEG